MTREPGPTGVEDYLATFTGPAATMGTALRDLCRASAPEATEAIKWRHPAYLHARGTILFAFSLHAAHANIVFTPSTKEAFDAELANVTTGKGFIKLPYRREQSGEPRIPAELVSRMISHRIREFERDGVLWMSTTHR